MKIITQADLYFCEGSSDKEYHAYIAEQGGGYIVGFLYGRRGAKLTEGLKTESPVTLDMARQVFEKLVSSKTKKGYELA
jgi:bifunctional non-homologous end joining protein LigD